MRNKIFQPPYFHVNHAALHTSNGIFRKLKFLLPLPTRQGTGLGLSLSYDIVKAHGGELKVETKQGEGSEFSIQLPTI